MADLPVADVRRWPALELVVSDPVPPPDLDDRVALAVDGLGALAIEHDEEGPWRIHFAEPATRDAAEASLRDALGAWVEVRPVEVDDEGWARKVQQDLGRIAVGCFLIAPPWDVPERSEWASPRHLIVIEPSTGFGTGHHQSTRLCLHALARAVTGGTVVTDVGTGSGILAIAAARLGARHVVALDCDPDALMAARANVAANGVGDRVTCELAELGSWTGPPAAVVVANLTMSVLRDGAPRLAGLVEPGGVLIASGFTLDQAPLVLEAFAGFELAAREVEDEWACLTLRRPASTSPTAQPLEHGSGHATLP